MLREVAHFLRVAPTAWRLQHRMSFLDVYDLVERDLDDAGKRQFRAALVADLDGLVLEIGAGTGLMLPHYLRGTRVVATEPDLAALRRAAGRARLAPARIVLAAADAGSLPGSVLCGGDRDSSLLLPVRGRIQPAGSPGGRFRVPHFLALPPV